MRVWARLIWVRLGRDAKVPRSASVTQVPLRSTAVIWPASFRTVFPPSSSIQENGPEAANNTGGKTEQIKASEMIRLIQLPLRFGSDESRSHTIRHRGNPVFSFAYPFSVTSV